MLISLNFDFTELYSTIVVGDFEERTVSKTEEFNNKFRSRAFEEKI